MVEIYERGDGMLTETTLRNLLTDLESETVERTRAFDKAEKMGQAISAFANDLAGRKTSGYLLLGVENNGQISGKRITDEQLASLGGLKTDGALLPPPAMAIEVFHLTEGDVVAIEVFPSIYPPIRYRGQAWIRLGARKALATDEDIHVLEERRAAAGVRFEELPCKTARLEDLDLDLFQNHYLPHAVEAEVITTDSRSIKEQMAALRFYDREHRVPTNLAVLLFAYRPELYIPSAYIQYVKFKAVDNGGEILAEHAYRGPLLRTILELDAFVKVGVSSPRPVKISALKETTIVDYPDWSIRELLLNAVIHRDYQIGNAPIKFYEYENRIEISNSGGLYGQANAQNFPWVNDYRNPLLAEAMKLMGYVNKFNRGIAKVKDEMLRNGNPEPIFDVNHITEFRVTLRPSREDGCGTIKSFDGTIKSFDGTIKSFDGTINLENGTIKPSDDVINPTDGTINLGNGTIKSSDGTINGEEVVFAKICQSPGIKREGLLIATHLSLRTIARILKRLSDNKRVEYRGSKRTGGWYVRT